MPFAATLSTSPIEAIRFQSCVDDKTTGTLCDWVYDTTDNRWLAESSDWLLAKPTSILVILLLAALIRLAGAPGDPADRRRRRRGHRPRRARQGPRPASCSATRWLSERRRQRAETMSSVLRSITTGVDRQRRGPDDPRRGRPADRAAAGQRRHRRRRGRLRRAVAGEGLPVRHLPDPRGPVRRRRPGRHRHGHGRHHRGGRPAGHPAARRQRRGLVRPQRRDPAGRQPQPGLVDRHRRRVGGLHRGHPAGAAADRRGRRGDGRGGRLAARRSSSRRPWPASSR